MTELASKTRSYVIVSDPLTLEGDGSTDLAHNLGVAFDQVAVIVVDRIDDTEFDITVTQPDVDTVRVVEGTTEPLVVVVLGFINDVRSLPTPAANWTVHEFGSLTKGYMYLSAEAALTGGGAADNFVHNCNRRPQIVVPIITDSLGGDYAVTAAVEAGANGLVRIQVTNAPGGTPGCRVLAFFGEADAPGTPPDVGAPATGVLLELASLTLAFVDVVGDPATPSVVVAASNFDFDHNRGRTLLASVPITQLGDDFDLSDVAEVGNVLNAVTVANTGVDDAHCLCLIIV